MRLGNPDMKALYVFKTVVDNHGFRGAQLALGVSPSVISTHIKALEVRFGFQLCQRGKGGFKLTEKGLSLYEACSALVGAVDAFELAVGELRTTLSGRLRIGLSANTISDNTLRIHDVVRSFEERGHDIFFAVSVLPTELLERGLSNGEFQLAIAPFVNHVDYIDYERLYKEKHRIYCAADHHLFPRSEAGITLDEVASARFVTRTYMHQDDLVHLEGVNVAASVSSMEAQLMMILSGHFIGYLADHYAAPWVQRGLIRQLRHPELEFDLQFYLASPRNRPRSQVFSAFVADVMAQIGQKDSCALEVT
jgi:LysR family transcriptional regulator, transcriptional activator for bauABCD operon